MDRVKDSEVSARLVLTEQLCAKEGCITFFSKSGIYQLTWDLNFLAVKQEDQMWFLPVPMVPFYGTVDVVQAVIAHLPADWKECKRA